MSYRPSPEWVAAVTRKDRHLVFVLDVDGAPAFFSSGPVRAKSVGGTDWDAPAKPLLSGSIRKVGAVGSRGYQLEGKYTIGDLSVQIVDVGGVVSYWAATEKPVLTRIYQRRATLWLGEASLPEDSYEPVFSGHLEDFELASGGGAYDVTFYSRLRGWDTEIMSAAEKHEGTVTAGDSSAPYAEFNAAVFGISNVDDYYNGRTVAWKSGLNDATTQVVSDFVGVTRKFTLTAGAPAAIDKNDTFSVLKVAKLVGNPVNIWVRLMLNDFALTGAIQTDYPLIAVTGSPTGLSYTRADLDEPQIIAERDLWLSGVELELQWTKPGRASTEFQEQIFRIVDAYPTVSPEGEFRFKARRPDAPLAVTPVVDASMVEGVPGWLREHRDLVNRVEVWGNWNATTDEYALLAAVETADARYTPAAVGFTSEIVIKSRGLVSARNGAALASGLANRILAAYGSGGPEVAEPRGGLSLAILEVGESVSFTSPHLPNIVTGRRGKTAETFEVRRVDVDWTDGRVVVEMVGRYVGRRPMFMGPSTMAADYGSASAADKKYGYLAPASLLFADGTAAYTVI